MPVVQQGSINTTALWVPDVYTQIVAPNNYLLNGLPTNVIGFVGTASWGPVNAPTKVSSMPSYNQNFGNVMPRLYDMGTAVWAAVLNGANNINCVRVTDGTDTAATATLTAASAADATAIAAAINAGSSALRGPSQVVVASASTTTVTITAKYTGSTGNTITASIGPASKVSQTRVVISLPGMLPESFDNLGAASASPASVTLAGGTDGATNITSSVLVGVDTIPRKGMYALRNTGTSIAALVDCSDTTSFTAQVAYGLSEGTYMVGVTPAGDTIANAVSTKATAGIDSYTFRYMFGDWILFNDTINNVQRLISPQGFVVGRMSALSPEQSLLNKPMQGIVATQSTLQNKIYAEADLQTLAQAGISVITNPIPAGNMFGDRIGCNSSSNQVINGDNYTRLTNYIAYTVNAGMGLYIGKLQTPKARADAQGTINAFLGALWKQGMIGDVNNPTQQPFSVQLNAANNPANRVALGYMQIDVAVTYLSVITKLILNIQGGQSVSVTVNSTTPAR
ncbi:phage tail protein [Undibacterium sp. MH2W]|uniref:phage tail protein n=1 Tax=Undibacterium sp. MH2W TaxID=3413044 RepID=UPI003BF1D6E3